MKTFTEPEPELTLAQTRERCRWVYREIVKSLAGESETIGVRQARMLAASEANRLTGFLKDRDKRQAVAWYRKRKGYAPKNDVGVLNYAAASGSVQEGR